MNTIINIEPGTFGTVRNGDLIGVANVVEHIRKNNNNPTIKINNVNIFKGKNKLISKDKKSIKNKP